MTSRTPRRHRRLALMAAGTAVAMVLVPGTALAQETPSIDDVVDTLKQMAESSVGGPAAPALPGVLPGDAPAAPEVPALPLDSDDDSDGHETPDVEPPDHGSGYVGDLDIGESDILDLTEYEAVVEDDGSTHSDVTVLGLLGDAIVSSGSSSDGTTESHENPTEGIGDATDGALSLSLLYHDTMSVVDDDGSLAAARGGVLSLCLLNEGGAVTTTYECEGLIGAGAAEGEGGAERDAKTGHSSAYSDNELVKACITEGWDGFTCKGLLGASVLHSDTDAESEVPENTSGDSWLIGLDSGGEALLRVEDPIGVALPPGCGDVAVLCLFLNQGETFIFDNPVGGSAAQEALHLDLLKGVVDILAVLGQSESIAHLESPEGCEPGEKGPCPTLPECSDGIDNDGDGFVDMDDPDCDSPDDSETPECSDKADNDGDGLIDADDPGCLDDEGNYNPADDDESDDGKKGGLADTGADVAPLLAGAFLLIGMGALTVAATRRRVGKHTV